MFIQIANDTLDALINLKHTLSITARPYKSGNQLVAEFPKNWKPFDRLIDKTGKVVILKGPCTEVFADCKLKEFSAESPKIERFARTPDNHPVNLNHIAMVIKERGVQDFHVIAYCAYGIERSCPRGHYLCYPTIDNEEDANQVFGIVAIQCGAIQLEDN